MSRGRSDWPGTSEACFDRPGASKACSGFIRPHYKSKRGPKAGKIITECSPGVSDRDIASKGAGPRGVRLDGCSN